MTTEQTVAERNGGLTENAMLVLKERYLEPGETVEEMWRRVAAGTHKPNGEYEELLSSLTFLPNSPTIMNRGTGKGTLSACFRFNIADSMLEGKDSIMAVAWKAAAVAKWGGGVGYYLGNIRAKNSPIQSTHRVACGPVAVLRFLNEIGCTLITQGGRRELAQMGILPHWHPDILDFIHCKDKDPQRLKSFNISVSVTDEFMSAVEFGKEEILLFDEIVDSSWRTGDPGMKFLDRIEQDNPTPDLGKLEASNPCFTGNTLVWTIDGPQRFDTLVGKEIPVLTQDNDGKLVFRTMRNIRLTRKNADVVQVNLVSRRGRQGRRLVRSSFTATGCHEVYLSDGSRKKVDSLSPGCRLSSAYRMLANSKGYLKLRNTCGDEEMEHRIVMGRPLYPQFHVHHKDECKWNNIPSNLEVQTSLEHNGSKMRGDKNPMIRFPELNPFNKGFKGESNGRCILSDEQVERIRELYDEGGISKKRLGRMFGVSATQITRIVMKLQRINHEFDSIIGAGKEDVYCGTVDDFHKFFVMTERDGAVLVQNCGEVDLLPDEACNLGSINLGKFVRVRELPTGESYIDWVGLVETVHFAIRFLDDILDDNWFPHEDITKAVMLTRKIGLGVMGLADMLAMLGIHYDSDAAVELARDVMKTIRFAADDESGILAKEKGPFRPGERYRNATRCCIAPTGSISLIANASSGIEPHYALKWTRKLHAGHVNERVIHEQISCLDKLPPGFVPKTAMQIPWEWHVRHQAAFQEFTDLAVSKSVNLPNNATREDVRGAFLLMWKLGCKGGTVFRDGCRAGGEQVLEDSDKIAKAVAVTNVGGLVSKLNEEFPPLPLNKRRKPPIRVESIRRKIQCGSFEGYVHAGMYPGGDPCEIFFTASKAGSSVSGLLESWAIAFSHALQHQANLGFLCQKFQGMRFEPNGITGDAEFPVCTSIVDFVARWLWSEFGDDVKQSVPSGHICPDCGSVDVRLEGGCLTCRCGWSRC